MKRTLVLVAIVCISVVLSGSPAFGGPGEPQQKRTEVQMKPLPFGLVGVRINNGATATADKNVKVSFYATGNPMYYDISENQSDLFRRGEIIRRLSPGNSIDFALSAGLGQKTVYLQLMDNTNAKSEIKSATIKLVVPPPQISDLVVRPFGSAVYYRDRNMQTSQTKVTVSLIATNFPTHFRARRAGETWSEWTAYDSGGNHFDIDILDPKTCGAQRLEVQVKNDTGPSNIASGAIDYIWEKVFRLPAGTTMNAIRPFGCQMTATKVDPFAQCNFRTDSSIWTSVSVAPDSLFRERLAAKCEFEAFPCILNNGFSFVSYEYNFGSSSDSSGWSTVSYPRSGSSSAGFKFRRWEPGTVQPGVYASPINAISIKGPCNRDPLDAFKR
jgi:hypothetical protein